MYFCFFWLFTKAEEKYHLKNSLYTACKIGDYDTLCNLLAVFQADQPSDSVHLPGQSNSVDSNQIVDHSEKSEITDPSQSSSQSAEDSLKIANDSVTTKHSDESDVISKDSVEILTEDISNIQKEYSLCDEDFNNTDSSPFVQINESGDSSERTTTSCAEDSSSVRIDNTGEKSKLNLTVSKHLQSAPEDILSPVVTCSILNEPIGDQQITLLHVVTKNGHKKLIKVLLRAGADPAIG